MVTKFTGLLSFLPIKKLVLFLKHQLAKVLFLPIGIIIFSKTTAQVQQDTGRKSNVSLINTDTALHKKQVEQKDLTDVFQSIFKKNQTKKDTSVAAITKPVFSVIPAIGYSLQTKLAAVISGNVVFRISPDARLSTITAYATYTQRKQFFIPVITDISTKGNRYRLLGDFRFYKYSQSTFGLGSGASIKNEDPMDYSYVRFYETVLKRLKGNFYIGVGYALDHHWKILHKGTLNGAQSDYANYESFKQTTSSGITISTLYDSRDNPVNAGKGFYSNLLLRNNLKALGSNNNWQSVIVDIRKYFPLSSGSHNTLALWSYNAMIVHGKPPFLDLPSTGWDSYNTTGRGFIQGRYRGTKMIYLESEYRFKISANGLFGGVLFANAESFSSVAGTGLEAFQPGYGGGLRIKINKQSNTNLSLDYGFGTQGSKGIFLTVGEVF